MYARNALKKGRLNEYGEYNEVTGAYTFSKAGTYAFVFVNRDYLDVVTVTWDITIYPAAKIEPKSEPTDVGDVVIGLGILIVIIGVPIGLVITRGRVKRYPSCNCVIKPTDKFCGQCGGQLKPSLQKTSRTIKGSYCPNCGARYAQTDKFCGICSTQLKST